MPLGPAARAAIAAIPETVSAVLSGGDDYELLFTAPPEAAAEISAAGEEDLYKFNVKRPGLHVVETSGSTDVVASLFGPNSPTLFVAEDADGVSGTNYARLCFGYNTPEEIHEGIARLSEVFEKMGFLEG